ncbi:MAG: alkaline phosphatase family protein [Deltaproteobacteria bacterium]|nr:alkaline phosphatase family protein [Deltaproteobacteria bacterium]MBW2359433.1 alkaline phosphatase family protein [Deltaproteobacteria bacterium]
MDRFIEIDIEGRFPHYGLRQVAGSICRVPLQLPAEAVLTFEVAARAEGLAGTLPVAVESAGERLFEAELSRDTPSQTARLELPQDTTALELRVLASFGVVNWLDLEVTAPFDASVALPPRWRPPARAALESWMADVSVAAPAADRQRLLIVGIDGGDWDLIDELGEAGELPVLTALKERGRHGTLHSMFIPESAISWSSMRTGVNPGRHGVFHFLTLGSQRPASYWADLSSAGLRSIVIAVPTAKASEAPNGVLIEGWTASADRGYVHPPELQPALARAGYRPDLVHIRNPRYYAEHLRARTDIAVALMSEQEWDHAFVVFEYADTAGHRFGLRSAAWRRVYAAVDTQLGRLVAAAPPDTTVLIVSDHGWRRFAGTLNVERALQAQGVRGWSTAFRDGNIPSLYSGSRIGIGPAGARDPDRAVAALRGLRGPGGKPLVEAVLPIADVFSGRFTASTPARLLVRTRSDLRAGKRGPVVNAKPVDHHDATGMYLAVGPGIEPGAGADASVLDVAPTVLGHFGVAPSWRLEGTPIFGPAPPPGDSGDPPNTLVRRAQTGEEAQDDDAELRARLRSIGYLE